MQTEPEVIFNTITAINSAIGVITLNRPHALNALNGEMVLTIYSQLELWEQDPNICLIIIKGNGRAFCAGGDLKEVYSYGQDRVSEGIQYYQAEYQLDLYINSYRKPFIALLDGFAMGGGLGISLHGSRVIGTEKLQLAMPETAIGFFPDVGASYFLSRCPDKIGLYLGLTGNHINVADACYAQLIHTYVPSNKLNALVEELASRDLRKDALTSLDEVITHFQQDPGAGALEQYTSIIEECFNEKSVAAIIQALEKNASKWAQQQAAILKSRSPTSLKVTLLTITKGSSMNLQECFEMEFDLACHMLQMHDIHEGIRAALIDKTNDPKWQPARLQDVNDDFVAQLFVNKCRF